MNPRIKSFIFVTACVLTLPVWADFSEFSRLKILDFPLPYCDAPYHLDIAASAFREIENQLPGTEQYNLLTKEYFRKNWDELAAGIKQFRVQFESSRLMEAVEFLEFQSELEQFRSTEGAALKNLENRFRDLLVLYPKSTLVPIIQGSMANFYMNKGAFSKALGLYQAALQEYPFHHSACVQLFGVAEANYLMGNLEGANNEYQKVLQKCQAHRLQVAARVRLADVLREQGAPSERLLKDYGAIQEQNPILVSRHHPELLFNLGELQYRKGNYSSASFYFNDFQRSLTGAHSCQPGLLKRLADLSAHKKENLKKVIGNYLVVYEKFPKNNLAKFSRIHGLLLDFTELAPAEADRREKLITQDITDLTDIKLRNVAELELHLARLERGEGTSLDQLSILKDKFSGPYQAEMVSFVRGKILAAAKKSQKSDLLEASYNNWFKGSAEQTVVESEFKELMLLEFADALDSARPKRALSKLERWKQSSLFNKKMLDAKTRLKIGTRYAEKWLSEPLPDRKKFDESLEKYQPLLAELIGTDLDILLLESFIENSKSKELEALTQKLAKGRQLASLASEKKTIDTSVYALILGKAFRQVKNPAESKRYLVLVTHPEWQSQKNRELIYVLSDLGNTGQAIDMGFQWLKKGKEKDPKEFLGIMRDVLITGKLWKQSPQIFKEAQRQKLSELEMVPYLSLNARALMEQKKWKESRVRYEEVLKISPEGTEAIENRFNLGRVLFNLKDLDGAKKMWKEVEELKNDFWSPLAANELKMLEKQ